MSNILILYSTTDGHTLTICKRIENYLNQKSKVSLIPLTECTKKVDKIIEGIKKKLNSNKYID